MFGPLILLVLDALVLAALILIHAENRLRRTLRALLVGLGLALTWVGTGWVCRQLFGSLIGWVMVVPLTILTAVVLMLYGRLPLKRAAWGAVIFLGLRFLLRMLEWLL